MMILSEFLVSRDKEWVKVFDNRNKSIKTILETQPTEEKKRQIEEVFEYCEDNYQTPITGFPDFFDPKKNKFIEVKHAWNKLTERQKDVFDMLSKYFSIEIINISLNYELSYFLSIYSAQSYSPRKWKQKMIDSTAAILPKKWHKKIVDVLNARPTQIIKLLAKSRKPESTEVFLECKELVNFLNLHDKNDRIVAFATQLGNEKMVLLRKINIKGVEKTDKLSVKQKGVHI